MKSVNICIFLGNVTRDPEIKYTPKGVAVAQVGMALNETWKDDQGRKHEKVSFIDLEAWNKPAEVIGEYVKKGDLLHVECQVQQDTWDDKQTGAKRSKLKFRIVNFALMPNNRSEHDRPAEDRHPQNQRPAGAKPPQGKPRPPADPDLDPSDEEASPFE